MYVRSSSASVPAMALAGLKVIRRLSLHKSDLIPITMRMHTAYNDGNKILRVSFVLSFFPRDVLDEILNLIESVSEGFPSYSCSTFLAPILQSILSRLDK